MKKNKFNLFLATIVIFIVFVTSVLYAQIEYTGVNLCGPEFGESNIPGIYGTDYIYPTSVEIDYYISKGMNTFRLPFRWERLQQSQFSPLDATELSRIDTFISYATTQGAFVIIEPHNFQRYYSDPTNFQSSEQGLIGTEVPDTAFADLWGKLANHYKENSRVIFNLMNEPNTMSTEDLVRSENAAIAAIRNAGADNLILVPGNQWTGAWAWSETWYNGANAEYMLDIIDPQENFAFEVHQYLDDDYSGGSSGIINNDPMIGVKCLTNFTDWLKTHNLMGFLGEFAVANSTIGNAADEVGDEVIDNMLNYLKENADVWIGWTWWAAGPWWGEYQFTLEPLNLGQSNQGPDRAAMLVLQPHMVRPSSTEKEIKVLTDSSPYTVLSGYTADIYGCEGQNNVTLESGAYARFINFVGNNEVTVQADSGLFNVSRSGASVSFEDSNGTLFVIPATKSAQTIIFNDITLTLIIDDNQVMLDHQIVNFTPTPIL